MVRSLLVILALGGCEQVFDLREVEPVANTVTGTFVQRSVANNASYEPMPLDRIVPASAIEFAAYLDDSITPTPVLYRDDGTFSFEVERVGQPYRMYVTIEGGTSEFQDDATHVTLAQVIAGRPERRAGGGATYLTFPYSGASPASVTSTGIYTSSETGMMGPTVTWDWRLASPAGSSVPGLLDKDQHDRVYVIEKETVQPAAMYGNTPAFSRIRALSQTSITQLPGSTATLPTPQLVTSDTCIHVKTTTMLEKARVMSAHARGYHDAATFWSALAVPAPSWTGLAGMLATGTASLKSGVTLVLPDLDVLPRLHEPYPGTAPYVETGVALFFYIQLGSANSAELNNVSRAQREVPRGNAACTVPATVIAHSVGILYDYELDGVDLAQSANKPVTLPVDRAPRLSWSVGEEGPIDFVILGIFEVLAVNNQTTIAHKRTVVVSGESAILDPTLFEVGHTYILAITSTLGRPLAPEGDWLTVAPPFENNTSWTHTFVIAEP